MGKNREKLPLLGQYKGFNFYQQKGTSQILIHNGRNPWKEAPSIESAKGLIDRREQNADKIRELKQEIKDLNQELQNVHLSKSTKRGRKLRRQRINQRIQDCRDNIQLLTE